MRPLEGAERRFSRPPSPPSPPRTGGRGFSLHLPRLGLRIDAGAAAATPTVRRDPAPSRLAYRLHRFWLTPAYRRLVRTGLPIALVAGLAASWLSDPQNQAAIAARYAAIKADIQLRPEFMISVLQIDGASAPVDRAIRGLLPEPLPLSSFRIDLEALRGAIAAIDAVASVEVRVRGGGVLAVTVRERVPAVIWQTAGGMELLDPTGHRVATLLDRAARPDLPLIAGEGAETRVDEALAILAAVAPVAMRVRGLVRMGERRWDLVLDRDQRILLPADGAVAAAQRVMALDRAENLLSRDITVVDMRNSERPTIRLRAQALAGLVAARPDTGQ